MSKTKSTPRMTFTVKYLFSIRWPFNLERTSMKTSRSLFYPPGVTIRYETSLNAVSIVNATLSRVINIRGSIGYSFAIFTAHRTSTYGNDKLPEFN